MTSMLRTSASSYPTLNQLEANQYKHTALSRQNTPSSSLKTLTDTEERGWGIIYTKYYMELCLFLSEGYYITGQKIIPVDCT